MNVSHKSVLRSWRRSLPGDEFWLQLRTSHGDIADFHRVVAEFADAQYEVEGPDGRFGSASPRGFVTLVHGVQDADQLESWVEELASRLTAAGLTGLLEGVAEDAAPDYMYEPHDRLAPTVFAAWTVDLEALATDPYRERNWHVPPEATLSIATHLVSQAGASGANTIVSENLFGFAMSDQAMVPHVLAHAALHGGRPEIYTYDEAAHSGCFASFGFPGQTALQPRPGDQSWEQRLGDLRDGLSALPHLLDQAFIRPCGPSACWALINDGHPVEGFDPSAMGAVPHLLDRFVLDAHGMQVLRDGHLANAHDLSSWTITPLGHGRHLVEARDLAPWFAESLPDPEAVASARRDFGDMIITIETVRAEPPPWPHWTYFDPR